MAWTWTLATHSVWRTEDLGSTSDQESPTSLLMNYGVPMFPFPFPPSPSTSSFKRQEYISTRHRAPEGPLCSDSRSAEASFRAAIRITPPRFRLPPSRWPFSFGGPSFLSFSDGSRTVPVDLGRNAPGAESSPCHVVTASSLPSFLIVSYATSKHRPPQLPPSDRLLLPVKLVSLLHLGF